MQGCCRLAAHMRFLVAATKQSRSRKKMMVHTQASLIASIRLDVVQTACTVALILRMRARKKRKRQHMFFVLRVCFFFLIGYCSWRILTLCLQNKILLTMAESRKRSLLKKTPNEMSKPMLRWHKYSCTVGQYVYGPSDNFMKAPNIAILRLIRSRVDLSTYVRNIYDTLSLIYNYVLANMLIHHSGFSPGPRRNAGLILPGNKKKTAALAIF